MKSKKIISILTIALSFIVTSSLFQSTNAYAAEKNTTVIEDQSGEDDDEFIKSIKIMDENMSFSNGHYSFDKNTAIKSGLSSKEASTTQKVVNELNDKIDNGEIILSSD